MEIGKSIVMCRSKNNLMWKSWAAFLLLILSIFISDVEGQYENTRCKCICPDPNIVINPSQVDNTTQSKNPTIFIQNVEVPNKCSCDSVVLPKIEQQFNMTGKEGEFCPRCDCRYESRNTTIIKVVVIFVIWIVSLLMIYMLFLMCLDPLLNKRIKSNAYQEHTNEDDESVGGGRTSHPLRVTGASSTTAGPSSSGVLNRVGHQQNKWKKQVQEQRRNIYDRHTMLN